MIRSRGEPVLGAVFFGKLYTLHPTLYTSHPTPYTLIGGGCEGEERGGCLVEGLEVQGSGFKRT